MSIQIKITDIAVIQKLIEQIKKMDSYNRKSALPNTIGNKSRVNPLPNTFYSDEPNISKLS